MAGGLEPPCPRDAGKLLNWRTGCELQLHCLSPSLSTLQPKFCVVALLCSARIPQIMAQRSESVLAAPTEKLRMIEETRHDIRANHPIRTLFHQLTERGMGQLNLHDPDTIQYITNLLTEFVHTENMCRIKKEFGRREEYLFSMLAQASSTVSPSLRRDYYKHLGDLTLFNLGLFPESLTYGHRTVSPEYYAETGRRSYTIVAEMDSSSRGTVLYRKLSQQFKQCVVGLNWVKLYISDPFYQFMFREFEIR